ncbi:MAG: S-methyl-5-thioribose-1-phosphate isomerase [Candidatus Bathyarchaeia archaeon]
MKTIQWRNGVVHTIDQSKLPLQAVYLKLRDPKEIASAIREMKIRGAPLIGAASALALALTAFKSRAKKSNYLLKELAITADLIKNTRPTAINLFNAINEILEFSSKKSDADVRDLRLAIIEKCLDMVRCDSEVNFRIGQYGASLIHDGDTILTHCNAGALATVEHGTAISVITAAHSSGKKLKVIATETRPLLQGSRLTTYELKQARIPVQLIADSAAGLTMARGLVDKIVVGADRILSTGHVINKIGTYMIASVAKQHNVPFYVAAPTTTLDLNSKPSDVIIEERDPNEIIKILGKRIAPIGVEALNPAFDMTPPELVSAVITERGVIYPPFRELREES